MCQNHVDPSCLLEKDADMCVFQDMERILAANQAGRANLSRGGIAGVVVAGASL